MNITSSFKASDSNSANIFGTMTATTTTSLPANGSPVATGAGVDTAAAVRPPALPAIMPAPAGLLFADAMGNAVQGNDPAANTTQKTLETDRPAEETAPMPVQAAPLPSMAPPWLPAPVVASSPQTETIIAAVAATAHVAAARNDAPPTRVAVAAAPQPEAMNPGAPPVAMQFNAQLGTLLPAPRLGAPLAAAMPLAAGPAQLAAPAGGGKPAADDADAPADAVQTAVNANMPAAASPAVMAAVLPPVTATAPRVAAAEVRPAVRAQAGLADAPRMPAKTSTSGGTFAAPLASAIGSPDLERTPAAMTPAASVGQVAAATVGTLPAQGGDVIKLNGTAQQWQEPLREALGERLQTQIGRNSEHAVIRLDPPMLGRIDISIRHTAGMLQVNVSASNPEVLRQLQGIGDNMRSDLAQRQYTEVAVNISATPRSPAAQAFAEGDARGQRQSGRQQDEAEPGRALSDGTPADTRYGATFAMHEREYN